MKPLLSIVLLVFLAGCASPTVAVIDGLRQVRPGMTEADVAQRAGQPLSKEALAGGSEIWTWKFVSPIEGQSTVTIILKNGVVLEVPDPAGDNRSSWLRSATWNGEWAVRHAKDAARDTEFAQAREQMAKDAEVKRQLYAKSQTHRPAQILRCVQEQKICVGMTEEEVQLSWGSPSRKNKTGGVGGSFDQWVYEDDRFVYFRNGALASWQVSE
jgi:hypothetical protein